MSSVASCCAFSVLLLAGHSLYSSGKDLVARLLSQINPEEKDGDFPAKYLVN